MKPISPHVLHAYDVNKNFLPSLIHALQQHLREEKRENENKDILPLNEALEKLFHKATQFNIFAISSPVSGQRAGFSNVKGHYKPMVFKNR